jgi:hypothetical protein
MARLRGRSEQISLDQLGCEARKIPAAGDVFSLDFYLYRTFTGDKFRPEDMHPALSVDEKHFTPAALAEAWGVDPKVIRNVFRDEPGVLKLGERSPKHKRSYLTLRIPKEVAERVHRRLSA